jgi:ornithine carbamoyltransferase
MLKNSDMEVIAKYATVPFINGCCNLFHPCQVLSDIFTIYEQSKHKTNTITYVGKLNNVSRELVNSLPKIGIKLYFVTKDVISVLSDENIDDKAKKSSNLICTNDFKTAVQNSNIVYTDAWIDMEFFNNPKYERNKKTITNEMLPYQVNKRVFEWNKDVCIMHDMPMHIGYEITRDIVESKSSWIFIQAENRMWVQNALMLKLLGHKIN